MDYCQKGGEIVHSVKCLGDSNEIYEQMVRNNSMNDRCHKKSFHIKIRPAPEDHRKLNTNDWIDISRSYADKIGFSNNPYVVYIHEEGSEKEHIHIVASRIKEDNKAVDNSFTHYKNLDFSREMEKKYNLRKVQRRLEAHREKELFVRNDKRIELIRERINEAIQHTRSTKEAIRYLGHYGIKVKMGRGINFIDSDGTKLKGSQIDRKYSLKHFLELTGHNNRNSYGRGY